MKVLLTGSTGYLGKNLVQRLLIEDFEIMCVLRKGSTADFKGSPKVTPVFYSESEPGSLKLSIQQFNPDITIHLAALSLVKDDLTKLPELIQSNILFGTTLLEILSGTNCKQFINTGTSWQHSFENSDLNLYSVSKTAFESFLHYYHKRYRISVITLKLFDTYGPNDTRSKIINLIFNSVRTNTTLGISPAGQELDLVYIDDVVEAFLVAMHRLKATSEPVLQSYGIGSGKPIKLRDLIVLWEEISGKKIPVEIGAREYREREVMTTWKEFLPLPGWAPKTSLSDGLKKVSGTAGIQ